MNTSGRMPRLTEMTAEEMRMIDAYLATGSFTDAARIVGCHRVTVQRLYWRYQAAIREAVKASWSGQIKPGSA